MARIRGLLIGGVVGAAAVYFLDPEQGGARRARLQGEVEDRVREARRGLDRTARQLQDRAQAAVERLEASVTSRPDDDLSLLSRLESALLALPGVRRGSFESEVLDGHVVLHGEVDSAVQEREILEAAGRVRGVAAVESQLQVPDVAAS
jgi:osmotically-inducible protein OsmY